MAQRGRRVGVEGEGGGDAVSRVGRLHHPGDELLVAPVDAVEDTDGHVPALLFPPGRGAQRDVRRVVDDAHRPP